MGGSRPSMRALHSRPHSHGDVWNPRRYQPRRGCAIPWRRPSWVRIPPPAPQPLSSGVVQLILDQAFYLKKEGIRTVHGASKLIKSSFEYVTEMDAVKLFRKRK